MAAKGYTDDRIAAELDISVATVRGYWLRVRGKLGGKTRTELVARWLLERSSVEGDRVAQAHRDQTHHQLQEFKRLLADERSSVDRLLKGGTDGQRKRVGDIRRSSDQSMREADGAMPGHAGQGELE